MVLLLAAQSRVDNLKPRRAVWMHRMRLINIMTAFTANYALSTYRQQLGAIATRRIEITSDLLSAYFGFRNWCKAASTD